MDLYILRDGQETGPHTEAAVRELLERGEVAVADFAWREGMETWLALGEVLGPAVDPTESPEEPVDLPPNAVEPPAEPSPQPAANSEPATPKQKALLSFLGIALAPDLSRDHAARLVNDAMEDGQNAGRLAQWSEERLRLHPELFASEIQAKRENRAAHFFELCQITGAEYFSGITKAHCQVLVGFLDVKFPHWDARESDAAEKFFFPAVAEKFPQLVNKPWRGRLQYGDGSKVAAELGHRSPTSRLQLKGTSPLTAIARGAFLGLLILGGLYLAHRTMQARTTAAASNDSPIEATPPPTSGSAPQPPVATIAPQDLPPIEPLPALAAADPAPAAPLPPATAPVPVPVEFVANPTPPMVTSEPAPPMAVANAAPTLAPPEPAPPMAAVVDPGMAPMAGAPSAVATAPMAALPGTEPPVPLPPPPATMPTSGILPNLPPEAAAIPPLTPAEMPPGLPPELPAAATARTNVLLTKSIEVQLAYGKMTLPAGTPVKLISRQGPTLKVSYQNSIMTIPAASTDVE